MCEIEVVEVLQTLGYLVQLFSRFTRGGNWENEATYQLQSIGTVLRDELYDVSVHHPL